LKREKLDLDEGDGYAALKAHVASKAGLARERYGPTIDAAALGRVLEDRDILRYPTELVFDSSALRPGEFAHAEPAGAGAERRYVIYVHEQFEGRPDVLPLLVAYHIPSVNYSDLVTSEEAELFGATLLGLEVEDYYQRVCALADELGGSGT